mmetsp:Transcript_29590/g.79458  ORF Transcript_29590/g.79458 Transcript_29590/m.79458 type:complete len:205 (+) Transcript_29590:822-1436(+)
MFLCFSGWSLLKSRFSRPSAKTAMAVAASSQRTCAGRPRGIARARNEPVKFLNLSTRPPTSLRPSPSPSSLTLVVVTLLASPYPEPRSLARLTDSLAKRISPCTTRSSMTMAGSLRFPARRSALNCLISAEVRASTFVGPLGTTTSSRIPIDTSWVVLRNATLSIVELPSTCVARDAAGAITATSSPTLLVTSMLSQIGLTFLD